MSAICPSCHFNNPPGMRFCGNCGTKLPEAEKKSEQAQVAPTSRSLLVGPELHPALAERFRKAGQEAAGQRRTVTVLCAHISGYEQIAAQLGSEELFDLMQQFLNLLGGNVYKWDGTIDKFSGDGLVALFGAPIAHENNAELALRAALDMRQDVIRLAQPSQALPAAPLHIHIGLHAGTVIVSGIGSDLALEYTAVGNELKISRRLMEAAPGDTVMVSQAVYHAASPLFDFDQPADILWDEEQQGSEIYRLLGPKSKPRPLRGLEGLWAPMVGRDNELRRLQAIADRLLDEKKGHFALVTGEAGIGKSRLILELRGSLASGLSLYQGQSQAYHSSVPYRMFQDLIQNFIGVDGQTPESELRRALYRKAFDLLGQDSGAIPYLEHLLNLKPGNPQSAEKLLYLTPEQLRQQVFLAVRDLFRAEAERRPLILVFEDLHWADEASHSLLQYLLGLVTQIPLLIIGTSRHYGEGPVERLSDAARLQIPNFYSLIHLMSLGQEHSLELLSRLLPMAELPTEIQSQILERSAGIPFYLEEILRMLLDGSLLRWEEDHFHMATGVDLTALGVPPNLEALILARFDRLGKTEQRLLQINSVIGQQFSLSLLKEVLHRCAPEQTRDDLAFLIAFSLLIDREFIVAPEDASREYAFKHVLLSDAIRSTLLKRDRCELHGIVAEAMEEVYRDHLAEKAELIAQHYLESTQKTRALEYTILAGRKNAAEYANAEARRYFETALDLLETVHHQIEQEVEVLEALGDVLTLTGEYGLARERYQAALIALATHRPRKAARERSELQRKVATTHERQGSYPEAMSALRAAQATLRETGALWPIQTAAILNDTGWLHFHQGDIAEAEENLLHALTLVENTPQMDLIASIYNRLGGVYYRKGQREAASDCVQKSLVLREKAGDRAAVARSYNNLGLLAWQSEQWDQALEYFTRSLELNTRLGDVEASILLNINLGTLLMDLGDLERSRQHLETSLHQAKEIGHSFLEGMACHHLCRLALAARRWQEALDYGDRGLQILSSIGNEDQVTLAELHISIGEAWVGLDSVGKAHQAAEQARQLLTSINALHTLEFARLLRLLGELSRRKGDLAQARRLLEESASNFRTQGNRLEQGRSSLALAQLAGQLSDPVLYRQQLETALHIFRQLGAKLDLAATETLRAKDSPKLA